MPKPLDPLVAPEFRHVRNGPSATVHAAPDIVQESVRQNLPRGALIEHDEAGRLRWTRPAFTRNSYHDYTVELTFATVPAGARVTSVLGRRALGLHLMDFTNQIGRAVRRALKPAVKANGGAISSVFPWAYLLLLLLIGCTAWMFRIF